MAEVTIAHPGKEATTEKTPAYVLRGAGIFELHREEILRSYQGGGRWLVPSGTNAGKLYEVRVGSRPGRDRCECVGFQHHKHCSHLVAAHRVAQLSAVCDGCGKRRWWSELRTVEEDDGLLSWYVGDALCSGCVRSYWS